MGGRGGGSSRGSGRAPSRKHASSGLLVSAKTLNSAVDPVLEDAIAKQVARLPESVRDQLRSSGVSVAVIDAKRARDIAGDVADQWNGFYWPRPKRSHVIIERFAHALTNDSKSRANILRNAGMTALHEIGHAYDYTLRAGTPVSSSTGFLRALAKDFQVQKFMNLSDPQRARMTFQRYPPGKKGQGRPQEVFAEAFAVAYGTGRPTPARKWNNSKKFAKAYPNVLEFVKQLRFERGGQ